MAGLNLGKIENLIDELQQEIAGSLDRFCVGCLLRGEGSVEQQIGHAENAVERRSHLVRDHRQKTGFRPARPLRLAVCVGDRASDLGALRFVALDALSPTEPLSPRPPIPCAEEDAALAALDPLLQLFCGRQCSFRLCDCIAGELAGGAMRAIGLMAG